MALRDTDWILDSDRALITSNAIVTKSEAAVWQYQNTDVSKDTGGGFVYTTRSLKQNATNVEREWICLTRAAALAAVDTNADLDLAAVETDRILGAYKVTQRVQVYGDWGEDT